jgi:hypothetical protein
MRPGSLEGFALALGARAKPRLATDSKCEKHREQQQRHQYPDQKLFHGATSLRIAQ